MGFSVFYATNWKSIAARTQSTLNPANIAMMFSLVFGIVDWRNDFLLARWNAWEYITF